MAAIDRLIRRFEAEREAEDDRLFEMLGGSFLSAWSPVITQRVNRERVLTRSRMVKVWSESWWRQRGYRVVWQPTSEDGWADVPGFIIERLDRDSVAARSE